MTTDKNIIIADQSALHALLHRDFPGIDEARSELNPLRNCADTLAGLTAFNVANPLYGEKPVVLLVAGREGRRATEQIACRFSNVSLPERSFFKLRDSLFMATPELVFMRMGAFASSVQLAEIGANLCGRYYLDLHTGKVMQRSAFLTTPRQISAYLNEADSALHGKRTALSASHWIIGNSGSPAETKMMLQFCLPLAHGGFNLPFNAMNYDISAGRLSHLTEQSGYSIDLVDTRRHIGLEYDGEEYHQDAAHDKQRRNELNALGWNVFPIDKQVLYDPERTIKFGELLARVMKVRLRRSAKWQDKFVKLRTELDLPI